MNIEYILDMGLRETSQTGGQGTRAAFSMGTALWRGSDRGMP